MRGQPRVTRGGSVADRVDTARRRYIKARYSYPLLFLVPSVMLAVLAAVFCATAGAGILWVFVYGDDPWPEAVHGGLMALAGGVFAVGLTTLLALGYAFGKRQEAAGGLRKAHALVAVGLSIGIPLLVLLHQWQIGNLSSKSGSTDGTSSPQSLRATG